MIHIRSIGRISLWLAPPAILPMPSTFASHSSAQEVAITSQAGSALLLLRSFSLPLNTTPVRRDSLILLALEDLREHSSISAVYSNPHTAWRVRPSAVSTE